MSKPTNEMRMQVINELLEELTSYGHYTAVTHVENCKKRLQERMDRVAYWEEKTRAVRHQASGETTADTERQMEAQQERVAVSGIR